MTSSPKFGINEGVEIIKPTDWISNLKWPLIIAGPCAAESEEQVLDTARQLQKIEGVRIFRAGLWKPRTRPGSFAGVGGRGLSWLKRVRAETSLLLTTEVASAHHVELALKNGIDVLWIGARSAANPFSVQEIARALKGVDVPVMIKNPLNADLGAWLGAIERIGGAGITKLVAVHRGFASYRTGPYRNSPLWSIPSELKKKFPLLPIICDPSHIGGDKNKIAAIAGQALGLEMDGLMIEAQVRPETALSDARQQITPQALGEMLKSLKGYTQENAQLEKCRWQIDQLDQDILESLRLRFKIVGEIAKIKKANNLPLVQVERKEEIVRIQAQLAKDMGISESLVRDIYQVIHRESVKKQDRPIV